MKVYISYLNWPGRSCYFSPSPSQQAIEAVFSKKQSDIQLPTLMFNNDILTPSNSHKHRGMILDSKRNFNNHLNENISKANKGNGIIRRLFKYFPIASIINICKPFVRPHLDYCDIISDKYSNKLFSQMIKAVQYNATLSTAVHGSSREKLYLEIGFESLNDIPWRRKLCFYYKIRQNICLFYITV